MRHLKFLIAILLASIAILLSVVIWRPALFLHGLFESTLASQGYTLIELGFVSIGQDALQITNFTVIDASLQIVVTDLSLTYSLESLLSGRGVELEVDRVRINRIGNDKPLDELVNESTGVFASLAAFEEMPFDSLSVHALSFEDELDSAELRLAAKTEPFSVAIEALTSSDNPWRVSASLARTNEITIASDLTAYYQDVQALSTYITATDLGENLLLSMDADLSLETLAEHPLLATYLSDISLLDDELELQSTMTVADDLNKFSASSFEVILNRTDSVFQLVQQSEIGTTSTQIHLPIVFTGSVGAEQGLIQASSHVIYGDGGWDGDNGDFDYQVTFESIDLTCNRDSASPIDCQANSFLQVTLPAWLYNAGDGNSVSGKDLSVEGPISVTYTSSGAQYSSAELSIAVPTLASIYGDSSLDLKITELNGVVGERSNGGFRFASSSFTPGISGYDFSDPKLSGLLQLDSELLTAVVELNLAEQLKLGAAIQHYFSRNTGTIEIQLAPLQFDLEKPLSGIFDQSLYSFDVEAGAVSGRADVSWSLDQSNMWRVGGPVVVDFDNVSGFVENTLFINFSSHLFAEVTTPFGLLSGNGLTANLDSFDPGMPLNDIKWEYGFDTSKQEFRLRNFEASLLGGRLEVPSFNYSARETQQQIDIILSNLEMADIVALADYPNVAIDGKVSGYLPLLLADDTFTIEDGLVGALSPGGTIRYTPVVTAPASNPSIQLLNDALSNYQYRLLDTQVDYDENGDLEMAVQLQGQNPDMNNGQEINLNVNVTDNLPTLLRSLQAGRSISDELERQLRLREKP